MSVYANHIRSKSLGNDRLEETQLKGDDYVVHLPSRRDSLPNILPELTKVIRKLLPHELLFNVHVRNVEYIEAGCERLSGTLYMTVFRLVFAPDNETSTSRLISSGNKYIGEYDIPLTSIYRIDTALDSRTGIRAFLSEHQGQVETRAFTILTRDFRNITFSKSSIRKSHVATSKPEISSTKMETYINALRVHTRCQDKEQLYPYLATQKPTMNDLASKWVDEYTVFSADDRSSDDDIADFCLSSDERIRSYLIYRDWHEELQEANENRWIADRKNFSQKSIARNEGPFVRYTSFNGDDTSIDLVWHWTHTSDLKTDRSSQRNTQTKQYMLVTVLGIGEVTISGDSLRRSNIESTLTYTTHSFDDQQFQRYNLTKFPCTLKRLEVSYEKLMELCVTMEEDDEKWLTKLNNCRWLRYVSKALNGAASLAKLLNYKNIQLAGSDTDNSCLMSSLIQILLRPKCRTIKGFCELIVREWIIRGHPFRERFGQVISDIEGSPVQESPIFLLFLDCVHQLIHQNPFLFEFTEYFLIEIYHSACYCYHHTFTFNTIDERLTAIDNCPNNILILSTFDFSLYLYSEEYRLLKNQASIFVSQKLSPPPPLSTPPPPPPLRTRLPQSPQPSTRMTHIHDLLKQSLTTPRPLTRTSIRLEVPKVNPPLPINETPPLPPPPVLKAEQFEYEMIEGPQIFPSNLYVDWRLFNLVLWSRCYCRYDQDYLPTVSEQKLSFEISLLHQRIDIARNKSFQQIPIDDFHSINHANSWHPQMLSTRV